MSDDKPEKPKASEVALRLIAGLLKELGVTNFIVLFAAFFLIFYASKEQKERFIDTWFLLSSERHVFCAIIIACILLLMIIGTLYFRTMLRLSKLENQRIGKEKSLLQERLIGQKLSSSDESQTLI